MPSLCGLPRLGWFWRRVSPSRQPQQVHPNPRVPPPRLALLSEAVWLLHGVLSTRPLQHHQGVTLRAGKKLCPLFFISHAHGYLLPKMHCCTTAKHVGADQDKPEQFLTKITFGMARKWDFTAVRSHVSWP